MGAAQVLTDVRQLLDRVGWTQGTERDVEGHACLVGALLAVCKVANVFPTDGLAEPLRFLREAVAHSEGAEWHGDTGQAYNELEVWNDEPQRTYAEVVALLEAAEQLARQEKWAAAETVTAFTSTALPAV